MRNEKFNKNKQEAIEKGLKTYHGKPCKWCGQTEKTTKGSNCIICHPKRIKKWKKENAERVKKVDKIRNLKQYDMTIEDYNFLLKKQDYKCVICGTNKCSSGNDFAVDHDHYIKDKIVIRGLLCMRCNTSIAHFEKEKSTETLEILEKVINYLIY